MKTSLEDEFLSLREGTLVCGPYERQAHKCIQSKSIVLYYVARTLQFQLRIDTLEASLLVYQMDRRM